MTFSLERLGHAMETFLMPAKFNLNAISKMESLLSFASSDLAELQ